MNLMRTLLVVVPAGIIVAASGGGASGRVAHCGSLGTAVVHGTEAAAGHAAEGDSRRTVRTDASAGIRGDADGASRQCAEIRAGLTDWGANGLFYAYRKALALGRESVPCLVPLLRDRSLYGGPCGKFVESSDYRILEHLAPEECTASPACSREPEVREVALYIILHVLSDGHFAAAECRVERATMAATARDRDALFEAVAQRFERPDGPDYVELVGMLAEHGFSFWDRPGK